MHSEPKRIFLFLAVGAAATAVNYLVFWICLDFFRIFYLVSNGVGYCAGVGVGFLLNARYTFEMGRQIPKSRIIFYVGVYLVSLALSNAALYGIVTYLKIPPLAANVMAILQSTMTNYLGCKYIVFRKADSHVS